LKFYDLYHFAIKLLLKLYYKLSPNYTPLQRLNNTPSDRQANQQPEWKHNLVCWVSYWCAVQTVQRVQGGRVANRTQRQTTPAGEKNGT